ncbi:MAG: hypothetical protein V4709_03830 [Pseudomonadota bacterium]
MASGFRWFGRCDQDSMGPKQPSARLNLICVLTGAAYSMELNWGVNKNCALPQSRGLFLLKTYQNQMHKLLFQPFEKTADYCARSRFRAAE